jgi:hypothetical protein
VTTDDDGQILNLLMTRTACIEAGRPCANPEAAHARPKHKGFSAFNSQPLQKRETSYYKYYGAVANSKLCQTRNSLQVLG